jgi:hypothetical protein
MCCSIVCIFKARCSTGENSSSPVAANEDALTSKKLEFFRRPPINLRSTDFKLLADSLLSGTPSSDLKLINVFECSSSDDDDFSKVALTNVHAMILWQNFQVPVFYYLFFLLRQQGDQIG